MNESNPENDFNNQGTILSPKKNGLIEKIEELIELERFAIDGMKKSSEAIEKSTAAMEKSLKNQEILVQYIYNAIKKQEEEAKKHQEEKQKK